MENLMLCNQPNHGRGLLEETIICEGCEIEIPISKAKMDDDGVWLCQDCYTECVKNTNQEEE